MFPNQSDKTEDGTSTPKAAQPEASQEQTQPEYVTKQDFENFRKLLQQDLNKNYQGLQSKTDSYQSNIQKQIGGFEQQLRDLQAKGIVKMTEAEISQAVRENQIDQLLKGQQTQAAQPGQLQPEPGESQEVWNKKVTEAGQRIEQKYGITLEEGDPEIAAYKIDQAAQSPNYEDYLLAIQQASQAKAARLKQQSPARAPGLLPHSPDTSNPLVGVTDLDAIWQQTSLGKLKG